MDDPWLAEQRRWLSPIVEGVVLMVPRYNNSTNQRIGELQRYIVSLRGRRLDERHWEIKQPMALEVLQQNIEEHCRLPLIDVRLQVHGVNEVGLLVHRHSGRHRRLAAAEPLRCECSPARTCDACYVFSEDNLASSSSIQSNSERSSE